MAKISLILIVTFFLAQTLNGAEIYGTPKIIDGDTIILNAEKIRFYGIDTPEVKQKCTDNNGQSYSCGIQATLELKNGLV